MATSSELLQVFTGFYKSPSICELCDMTRTTQKISKCSLLIENAKMYISYSAIDMPFIKNGGWPFDGFTSATPFVATLRAGDHLEALSWSLSLKPFINLFISDPSPPF